MQKTLLIATAIIIAAALIAMPLAHEADAQKKDKKEKKQKQCNNVKVRVAVDGAEVDDVLVGTATIGMVTVSKIITVENDTETSTLAFNFKKINPCPPLGSEILGHVNGTGFTGELKTLKKPNKISVSLN